MGVLDEEGVCILGGRGVGEISCSSLWLSSVANQLSLHHTTHKHHPQFPPSQNNSNTLPPHTGKTFDTTNPNLPVSKISITYKKPALNYKLHQKKPPKFLPHFFSPFPFLFFFPPIPSFSPSTYSIPFSTLYIPLSPPLQSSPSAACTDCQSSISALLTTRSPHARRHAPRWSSSRNTSAPPSKGSTTTYEALGGEGWVF